jgi:hypothetical protein
VPTPAGAPARPLAAPLARLPLAFEPNAGQASSEALFLARIPNGTLFFTRDALMLAARSEAGQPRPLVRVEFLDANPATRLEAAGLQPGRVSYFKGRDPARWQRGLPRYATLHYRQLYPGIDLAYGDAGDALKGTYTVAPGADPTRIRWRYTGVTALDLDPAGNLQTRLALPQQAAFGADAASSAPAVLTERAPVAWQERGGQPVPVAVRYALQPDGTVGFAFGPYDPRETLVVDPELVYASYLGGVSGDTVWGMTVDAAGNIYLTGDTVSADFPLQSPIQPVRGGRDDVFVSVLDASGTSLIFSTYLGGSFNDLGAGIGVDAQGNVYVGGGTSSPDFPVVNALQPIYGGGDDAFVAEIDPTGTRLVYSTYLGGGALDGANDLRADASGRAYVAGATESSNLPVINALQPVFGGVRDIFVARLAPGGAALEYSTYLGGSSSEFAEGLAVDTSGGVYLTGVTGPDFPLVNPAQPVYGGGVDDAFVSKIAPAGFPLVYSTYLGGSSQDWGLAIAVDARNQAYATGFTRSTDFPLVTPLQTFAGGADVFVTQLNASGTAFAYSTYLGGQAWDRGFGITVDRAGRAWVTGQTESSDFPTVHPIQAELRGADIFISELAPDQPVAPLLFSTYLGGGAGVGGDIGYAAALDGQDNVYVGGETTSTDFPLAGQPFQSEFHGIWDGVVVKLGVAAPTPTLTPTPSATLASPTATPSPAVTLTPAPSATATSTPTASGTPVVRRVYTPLVLHNVSY